MTETEKPVRYRPRQIAAMVIYSRLTDGEWALYDEKLIRACLPPDQPLNDKELARITSQLDALLAPMRKRLARLMPDGEAQPADL